MCSGSEGKICSATGGRTRSNTILTISVTNKGEDGLEWGECRNTEHGRTDPMSIRRPVCFLCLRIKRMAIGRFVEGRQ